MSLKAICLITFKPNKIYLDFLNKFNTYDIYIIIDDNENDYSEIKIQYPKINFIQIKNEDCTKTGFTNTSYITIHKPVIGWDKALYFFSYINCIYDYIWFMEDDVYFYNENTLQNIDTKYTDFDLLCNSSFEPAKLNEWLWHMIQINLSPPYYCGMMCITRFSKKMIESIKDYAIKNKTVFFLEALYPTIAIKYNLKYVSNPIEFLTVTHRDNYDINLLNKDNLYHPIKNIESHIETRNK
jgi:hypothetical protein